MVPRAYFFTGEPFDLAPLPDLLQIVVLEHELLAIDGYGGAVLRETLGIGERVRWAGSRGRVAVVLTDRRILAATPRAPAWAATQIRVSEQQPLGAILGDRVALVLTDQRVIGVDGIGGTLVAAELAPREDVLAASADTNVAVVVTPRRALGLAAYGGGFFETEIAPRERVEAVDIRSNFATVTTRRELLVFAAPSALWQRRLLPIH